MGISCLNVDILSCSTAESQEYEHLVDPLADEANMQSITANFKNCVDKDPCKVLNYLNENDEMSSKDSMNDELKQCADIIVSLKERRESNFEVNNVCRGNVAQFDKCDMFFRKDYQGIFENNNSGLQRSKVDSYYSCTKAKLNELRTSIMKHENVLKALMSNELTNLTGRVDEFRDIISYIRRNVQRNKGGAIFVSGSSGTGKTYVINAVVAQLYQEIGNKFLESDPLYINCSIYNKETSILDAVLHSTDSYVHKKTKSGNSKYGNHLRPKCVFETNQIGRYMGKYASMGRVIDNFKGRSKITIFIVDEVDFLDSFAVTKPDGKYKKRKRRDVPHSLLALLRAATNMNSRVFLIAITNSPEISSYIKLPDVHEVTFMPYNENELKSIISARLKPLEDGNTLFEDTLINILVRRIVNKNGDCRLCIDGLCRLVSTKLGKLRDSMMVLEQKLSNTNTIIEEGNSMSKKLASHVESTAENEQAEATLSDTSSASNVTDEENNDNDRGISAVNAVATLLGVKNCERYMLQSTKEKKDFQISQRTKRKNDCIGHSLDNGIELETKKQRSSQSDIDVEADLIPLKCQENSNYAISAIKHLGLKENKRVKYSTSQISTTETTTLPSPADEGLIVLRCSQPDNNVHPLDDCSNNYVSSMENFGVILSENNYRNNDENLSNFESISGFGYSHVGCTNNYQIVDLNFVGDEDVDTTNVDSGYPMDRFVIIDNDCKAHNQTEAANLDTNDSNILMHQDCGGMTNDENRRNLETEDPILMSESVSRLSTMSGSITINGETDYSTFSEVVDAENSSFVLSSKAPNSFNVTDMKQCVEHKGVTKSCLNWYRVRSGNYDDHINRNMNLTLGKDWHSECVACFDSGKQRTKDRVFGDELSLSDYDILDMPRVEIAARRFDFRCRSYDLDNLSTIISSNNTTTCIDCVQSNKTVHCNRYKHHSEVKNVENSILVDKIGLSAFNGAPEFHLCNDRSFLIRKINSLPLMHKIYLFCVCQAALNSFGSENAIDGIENINPSSFGSITVTLEAVEVEYNMLRSTLKVDVLPESLYVSCFQGCLETLDQLGLCRLEIKKLRKSGFVTGSYRTCGSKISMMESNYQYYICGHSSSARNERLQLLIVPSLLQSSIQHILPNLKSFEINKHFRNGIVS